MKRPRTKQAVYTTRVHPISSPTHAYTVVVRNGVTQRGTGRTANTLWICRPTYLTKDTPVRSPEDTYAPWTKSKRSRFVGSKIWSSAPRHRLTVNCKVSQTRREDTGKRSSQFPKVTDSCMLQGQSCCWISFSLSYNNTIFHSMVQKEESNPFKSQGFYTRMYHLFQHAFCPQSDYMRFRMVLTVNSDCFPEQHQPADLSSGDDVFGMR
jgi:hypothetical protein